jgi:hypothetical protein
MSQESEQSVTLNPQRKSRSCGRFDTKDIFWDNPAYPHAVRYGRVISHLWPSIPDPGD